MKVYLFAIESIRGKYEEQEEVVQISSLGGSYVQISLIGFVKRETLKLISTLRQNLLL